MSVFQRSLEPPKTFASCGTLHGEGVTIDQGDITVRISRAGEEEFPLGVTGTGIGLGTNKHGATGIIVMGDANLAASGAKGAFGLAPHASVGIVPVWVVGGEGDALLVLSSFGLFGGGDGRVGGEDGVTVGIVVDGNFIIGAGYRLSECRGAAECEQEEQRCLVGRLHGGDLRGLFKEDFEFVDWS